MFGFSWSEWQRSNPDTSFYDNHFNVVWINGYALTMFFQFIMNPASVKRIIGLSVFDIPSSVAGLKTSIHLYDKNINNGKKYSYSNGRFIGVYCTY